MSDKGKKPSATSKKSDKSPRDRFLTVGANRVGKAMKAIRNVSNIANRKSYEYNEAEARKAITTLRAEVDAVEKTFNEALAGKGAKAEAKAFSFA